MKASFTFLSFLLIAICFLIGLIHIYWASNGQWGRKQVIPTNESGEPLFEIGPISCMLVALVMFGLSFFYLEYYKYYENLEGYLSNSKHLHYGLWIISIGFLARSIGDFKYVGFFKSIRKSSFGRLDSKYFSPLCFLLGAGSVALYFLTH